MKILFLYLFLAVYPLQKGEVAPEPVVAFDTLSAKKLLYMLDSLEFVSQKLNKAEKLIQITDSLLQKYREKVEILEKTNKNMEEQNKILNKEIKLLKKEKWIERFIFGGILGLIMLIILR